MFNLLLFPLIKLMLKGKDSLAITMLRNYSLLIIVVSRVEEKVICLLQRFNIYNNINLEKRDFLRILMVFMDYRLSVKLATT